MYSLVIPVYRNEDSLPELVEVLEGLNADLNGELEAIFVIDGSPDRSFEFLADRVRECRFRSRLLLLARNFGSFAAIGAGLKAAHGPFFGVMAADLQEPPELIRGSFQALASEAIDVVVCRRQGRHDPLWTRLSSGLFWFLYRKVVQSDMPPGGIDVFACNSAFRDQLLAMQESNSSLPGLVVWMGFRRKVVGYTRRVRRHGRSAWTFRRRLRYMADSVYSFTDLPIRMLLSLGIAGLLCSAVLSILVVAAKLNGQIPVPGYAATVLVVLFFAAFNAFGLGIIGSYVWRTFENTKGRPRVVVLSETICEGKSV